jgi:restriction system protein
MRTSNFVSSRREGTRRDRDNGYDIIAIKYFDQHTPLKFLVECKRFSREKVGVEIIRCFKEVIATESANRRIIVTTSYFTKDAIKKKNATPYLLDYRDKDAVMQWVFDYQNS